MIRVELPEWMMMALAEGWEPPYISREMFNIASGCELAAHPSYVKRLYEKRRAWEYANLDKEEQMDFNPKYETRIH